MTDPMTPPGEAAPPAAMRDDKATELFDAWLETKPDYGEVVRLLVPLHRDALAALEEAVGELCYYCLKGHPFNEDGLHVIEVRLAKAPDNPTSYTKPCLAIEQRKALAAQRTRLLEALK